MKILNFVAGCFATFCFGMNLSEGAYLWAATMFTLAVANFYLSLPDDIA